MIAQLRSELRKMATTRTNLGLLLGLIALVLFGVIAGSFGNEADFTRVENQRELIGNGAFGAIFAALIGVMAMTSEFRHGTIRATFVFTPTRARVVAAKVFASMLVGIGFGTLASAIGVAMGAAMIRARGFSLLIDSGDVRRLVLGTIVMSALWAARESASARWSATRCSPSSDCLPGCSSLRCSSFSTCPERAGTRRARRAPR